jgi:hypothetical protein
MDETWDVIEHGDLVNIKTTTNPNPKPSATATTTTTTTYHVARSTSSEW